MNTTPPEKLLPKEAIADLVGMRPRTVLGWYHTGKIKGVKIGRRVRFYWSAVEAALVKEAGTK